MAIKRASKFIGNGCLIEDSSGTGKTKLFAAFAIIYLQSRLHILMTGPIDESSNVIIEQLSELINDSPTLNLKLTLWVYQPQNKKLVVNQSLSALRPGLEKMQKQYNDELVLLKLFVSI